MTAVSEGLPIHSHNCAAPGIAYLTVAVAMTRGFSAGEVEDGRYPKRHYDPWVAPQGLVQCRISAHAAEACAARHDHRSSTSLECLSDLQRRRSRRVWIPGPGP